MGQTLNRARKGTSATQIGGKLEFNAVNEHLLQKVIEWVQGYASAHPGEAKLRFKSALSWPTGLGLEHFGGANFEQRGDDMVSLDTAGPDGPPVIRLHKDSDGHYKMSVLTVADLSQVLNIAGDRKLDETRACLEANADPISSIAGDRFAAVNGEDLSAYRFMEEIMKSPRDDSQSDEDKKLTLRLVMHLQKLDQDLLQLYAEQISSTLRLTPLLVEQDVGLIKEFCGEDEENHVLEEIQFTTDHKFQNGCRSPPWRQIHGDISYIEVRPHDEDVFFVTACTTGYYINKGWNKEKNELDHEKVGDVFSSLVELLKTKSARFAELISKQTWDVFSDLKHNKHKAKSPKANNNNHNHHHSHHHHHSNSNGRKK